jgi:hypothetical protein
MATYSQIFHLQASLEIAFEAARKAEAAFAQEMANGNGRPYPGNRVAWETLRNSALATKAQFADLIDALNDGLLK